MDEINARIVKMCKEIMKIAEKDAKDENLRQVVYGSIWTKPDDDDSIDDETWDWMLHTSLSELEYMVRIQEDLQDLFHFMTEKYKVMYGESERK